jgi:NAD(P)H-dependent FMN reductase
MDQQHSEAPIKVIGLCGSLRKGSYTRMALEIVLAGAAELGADIHLIDLRNYNLVFCDGERDESTYPQDVFNLRNKVKAAQGLILGTPEYHSSLSGVLKNALDLMSFKEFEGKMVGLVGVSGGSMGAINALNTLRTIGRSLHAWILPEQVSIPQSWKVFDETEGRIKDSEIEQRLMEMGRQVSRFAYLHTSEKSQEFLRLWETAPVNPGGVNRD